MDIDLRKTQRKKPQLLIYVELGQDNGGMMRDLSENGMGFRSMGPLQRGAKVPFSFSFSAGELVEGVAELIWTDSEGRAGGLRFVDVEGVRGQIHNWLTREESPAIVEDGTAKATFAEKKSTFEELRRELRGETSPAVATTPPIEPDALAVEAKDDAPVETETSASEAKVAESAAAMPIAASTEILSPPSAQEPFQKEINFGLEPLTPLEGTLPKPRWVENVTLGWVVTAMVILTLLAAGVVYHRELGRSLIWLGAKIVGPQQTNTISSQPMQPLARPTESGTGNPTSGTASSAADSTIPETHERQENQTTSPVPSTGTRNAKSETPVPGVRQTPAQDVNRGNVGNALKNEGNGRIELQQAMKILRGEVPSGNISDAVQLLWVAVERGNSDAEVALADLYRAGAGVPQNCDQARVLLSAAAKKGNSQAKARLDEIAQTGCQ